MKNPIWLIPVLVCSTLLTFGRPKLAAAADESAAAVYRAVVGQPHPDFVLPRIDNHQPLRLSDYRGRKVLLIHFASW